jgi:S-ribosylhomocysteine lyase
MKIDSNEIKSIASFSVDHDLILPGIYVSRIDGDITTYDMRTRRPNGGDYMDNVTMHSVEHMFATLVRNSEIGDRVIYFGPMGCRTGFYLLVRDADNREVLSVVKEVLERIADREHVMYGASRVECGNYLELDLDAAKAEARRYLEVLNSCDVTFIYPEVKA